MRYALLVRMRSIWSCPVLMPRRSSKLADRHLFLVTHFVTTFHRRVTPGRRTRGIAMIPRYRRAILCTTFTSEVTAPHRPYQLRVEKSVKPWRKTDVKKSRFSEEQNIGFRKQADTGMPIKKLCRQVALSPLVPECARCRVVFFKRPATSWARFSRLPRSQFSTLTFWAFANVLRIDAASFWNGMGGVFRVSHKNVAQRLTLRTKHRSSSDMKAAIISTAHNCVEIAVLAMVCVGLAHVTSR